MSDLGRQRWHNLLRSWGVDHNQADQKFDDICRAYAESGRFYHTLDHVLTVLDTVQSLASFAKNLNAVKLAAWLHDVIYDSKALKRVVFPVLGLPTRAMIGFFIRDSARSRGRPRCGAG